MDHRVARGSVGAGEGLIGSLRKCEGESYPGMVRAGG